MNNDIRNLSKWLNEEQTAPIDRQALARVLAMAEQPAPAQQEIDWKDQYEKQKRRADMWVAKYEADIGPLEKAGPVAEQPAQQEPVAWMHPKWRSYTRAPAVSITPKEGWHPLYTTPQPPAQQEPVASKMLKQEEEIKSLRNDLRRAHDAYCQLTREPAQRKPLTLGQKQRLWSGVGDKPTLKDRVNAYGLAIEAAHGIKENT